MPDYRSLRRSTRHARTTTHQQIPPHRRRHMPLRNLRSRPRPPSPTPEERVAAHPNWFVRIHLIEYDLNRTYGHVVWLERTGQLDDDLADHMVIGLHRLAHQDPEQRRLGWDTEIPSYETGIFMPMRQWLRELGHVNRRFNPPCDCPLCSGSATT